MNEELLDLFSQNQNGYAPLSKKKFKERFILSFELLKRAPLPKICALSEVPIGGKGMPNINFLYSLASVNGYKMLLPLDFDLAEHPKYITNVLLVKDSIECKRISLKTTFPNRLNYIKLKNADNYEIYLFNVHIPQSNFKGHDEDFYVAKRRAEIKAFYEEIVAEISRLVKEDKKVILAGDFNMPSSKLTAISDLGLINVTDKGKATYYGIGSTNTNEAIDHIFASKELAIGVSGVAVEEFYSKKYELTDHAGLRAAFDLSNV